MSFNRLAAGAGFLVVVLLVLNVALLGDQPKVDESIAEYGSYIQDDEGLHKTALLLGILVLPFAAVFFSGVLMPIRESDREHNEGWAIAALIGGILLGATAGLGDTFAAVLFFRTGEDLDAATVRALWDGQLLAYASTGVAMTALTGAVAVPTLTHKLRPAWYGWLSAVVAVLGLLALISVVGTSVGASIFGLIALIGFLVWTLATSALLYRQPS
jgi:hypothetical protein